MKFMETWTVLPGTVKEAISRFLDGQAKPPQGVALLGRWHKVDCSGGFAVYETDDLAAVFEAAAGWADVLELHITPVVEDATAGGAFAKVFKK